MKKIGIITFHAAFNSGSMLQAYALQKCLQKLGHEVEIINFRSKVQKEMYAFPICINSYMRFLRICKRFLLHPEATVYLKYKWERFNDFLNTQLNLTKEYHTIDELKEANFNYDVIIYGSDQIWNTTAQDFNTAYIDNFYHNAKKVAYAVSMGPFPEKIDMEILKPFLKDFNALSFREARSANVINPFLQNKALPIVCDPTFLLQERDYFNLFKQKPLIKGRYIYCYTPYIIDDILPFAEKIAKDTNLPVVINNYCPKKILKKYPHVHLSNGGPSEFLNLIKHSEFTFGLSFHLLAFNLIFNKEFYLVENGADSRLNFMLNKLCLTDKTIREDCIINNEFVRRGIDYNIVNEKLNYFKDSSIDFLVTTI